MCVWNGRTNVMEQPQTDLDLVHIPNNFRTHQSEIDLAEPITLIGLEEVLVEKALLRGAQGIYIATVTEPKQVKNPYGKIYKISWRGGQIGADYEKAVNRQRIKEGKEGNFEAKCPTAFTAYTRDGVNISYLRESKKDGSTLLSMMPNANIYAIYYYINNGEASVLERSEIEEYLRDNLKPKNNKKTQENQGVSDIRVYRSYRLDNIAYLHIDGKRYKVIDENGNEKIPQLSAVTHRSGELWNIVTDDIVNNIIKENQR